MDKEYLIKLEGKLIGVTRFEYTEIKSVGATISGMDQTGYEITLFGISYPFYEYEFSHHVKAYKNKFK